MKTIHSITMRSAVAVASISLLSLLSACSDAPRGYVANDGHSVLADTPRSARENPKSFRPINGYNRYSAANKHDRYRDDEYEYNRPSYAFERRGYYNDGGYVATIPSPVADSMFPPRGMCRVWFAGRANNQQPAPESCHNIKSRVPSGAYVIYGG